MQLRKLEKGVNRDALEECQTRVLAIALIHEKLYQSRNYSHVPFSEYARSLASNVFHATAVSHANVQLDLAIDDVSLGVDRAIPCGLVLNELITNALKHGFTDGRRGTIRVELVRLDATRLRLTVTDDGAGLPANSIYTPPSPSVCSSSVRSRSSSTPSSRSGRSVGLRSSSRSPRTRAAATDVASLARAT